MKTRAMVARTRCVEGRLWGAKHLLILMGVILALVLASGGLAWAQVHGAPTTAAPPGQSRVAPPGPGGLPATSSPAANAAAANNPATAIVPGQPVPPTTNAAGVVVQPNATASGATTASGVPVTTDASGNSTTSTSMTTNATGVSSSATNSAGTSTITPNVLPTRPSSANAVGMPTARTPFVQPAPGQPAQSSAQAQGQATGR